MAIFITCLLLMTNFVVSSDMPDNSKTAYYITLAVIVLIIGVTTIL